LGTEESFAKSRREHATLKRVLAVVGGIVEKYATNGGRLVDDHHMADGQAAADDGPLKMLLRPAFERIAFERGDESQRTKPLWARFWRGRPIRRRRGKRDWFDLRRHESLPPVPLTSNPNACLAG